MEEYDGYIVKDTDGSIFFFCSMCRCYWKPRNEKKMPRSCPSCRSTVWMKPYQKKTCVRCGHVWGTTHAETKRCPACGTYRWNEAAKEYHCFRCDNVWNAKRDGVPKRCPKCNSTKWQLQILEGVSEGEGNNSRIAVDLDPEIKNEIMKRYGKGTSCMKIAIDMKLSFSTVFNVIARDVPVNRIRI